MLSEEERNERRQALDELIEMMRPAVQADGGDLVLVNADVETGEIEVALQGACGTCALSSMTLQGGVERILRDRLPWVTEVIGGVEDPDSIGTAIFGYGNYVPKY